MKKIELLYKKVNYNNLSLIAGNLAILYKEGISMIMIVDLLNELPLNRAYKESIKGIRKYILEGKSLEECFRAYDYLYPGFFIGMIAMGEKSGNLFKVLKGLEDYYNVNIFFRNTAKNALSYPILIVTTTIFLFIFILLFVTPNLYEFYITLDAEIPFVCKLSYNLSNYIKKNPLRVFIYIFDFILLLPYFLGKYYLKNICIRLLNKIPLYREVNEFLFVSILGIIIKSGVNLSEGLICAANSFEIRGLRDRFISLNNSILKGESISDSLINTGYYSNYTISIIKLGEEGGSMDERLDSLTSYLEKKLIDKINKKVAIIQPASILIIGGLVISFLMKFIVPLFSSIFEVAI